MKMEWYYMKRQILYKVSWMDGRYGNATEEKVASPSRGDGRCKHRSAQENVGQIFWLATHDPKVYKSDSKAGAMGTNPKDKEWKMR